MYTFSQMVDAIVSEVRRPDLRVDIARYVNQTIRECHFDPETNAVQFYKDNTREFRLPTTSESGQVWDIPTPTCFQKLAAVQYENVFDRTGNSVWPEETQPGRHLVHLTHYYYQAGSSFVFSGYGGLNAIINLYYFVFPSGLPYMAAECRPMEFNEFGGKIYAEDWSHDHSREDADCLTTNWLLTRWSDVVAEGVRAKVYKRVSDTERARTCYSLYAQLRKGLATNETASLGVV